MEGGGAIANPDDMIPLSYRRKYDFCVLSFACLVCDAINLDYESGFT